jgi:hypothetical protein
MTISASLSEMPIKARRLALFLIKSDKRTKTPPPVFLLKRTPPGGGAFYRKSWENSWKEISPAGGGNGHLAEQSIKSVE